jgi:phosphoenolpyruvate-protein kinase (PTS system EI component)
VTLCGELAGREASVPGLLNMGFRALSVAPTVIPTTKALIRKLDISAAHGVKLTVRFLRHDQKERGKSP